MASKFVLIVASLACVSAGYVPSGHSHLSHASTASYANVIKHVPAPVLSKTVLPEPQLYHGYAQTAPSVVVTKPLALANPLPVSYAAAPHSLYPAPALVKNIEYTKPLSYAPISKTIIAEPTYAKTIIAEPTYAKTIVSEPAYTKTIIAEPTYVKNIIPEPTYVKNIFPEPTYVKNIVSEPIYAKNIVPEPIYAKNIVSEPIYAKNIVPEPIYAKNIVSEPIYTKNVYAEPIYTAKTVIAEPTVYTKSILAQPAPVYGGKVLSYAPNAAYAPIGAHAW